MFLNSAPKPFTYAMLSHAGRVRKGNEDTCAASVASGAFVVCDGMGGAAAGEVASRLAADAFLAYLAPTAPSPGRDKPKAPRTPTPDVRVDAAIYDANRTVFEYAGGSAELRGMGTTLVALLVEAAAVPAAGAYAAPERPSVTLAHVGDSRCYLFRAGVLSLLTQDHSLVEEQVRLGQISPHEAEHHPMRNIITRAVGSSPTVEPEIRHIDTLPGDVFLLASDGLTRELSDEQLAAIFHRAQTRDGTRPKVGVPPKTRLPLLQNLCQILIDEANDAGGNDNITVLLVRLA